MVRATKLKYGVPVILFICFYLDGIIGATFQSQMFHYPHAISSYIEVLWLIFAIMFDNTHNDHLEILAMIIGCVFDLYYTGIMGVFVFVLPFIVILTKWSYRELSVNFLSGILIVFIDITIVTIASFLANTVTHLTSVSVRDMLVDSLGPTLAYNLVAFVILYYPSKRLFDWMSN